ncbi:MAG TPA: hypothetical protein VF623_00795, partial [Segetibacter sp.]
NKEIIHQKEEKEEQAKKLNATKIKLEKAGEFQTEYIDNLEKMMFLTSHQLIRPIANIMGILNHIDSLINSPDELEEMKGFLKQSAQSLDKLTRELTTLIHEQEIKLKKITHE